MVDTALWTARPTSTQIEVQMTTTTSLNNCASSRPGVVAYGRNRDFIALIPAQGGSDGRLYAARIVTQLDLIAGLAPSPLRGWGSPHSGPFGPASSPG